jgi:hypothetical protein
MVAVVREIVRTTSPARNATSVLATNFDLFMDMSLSSVVVRRQSHVDVQVAGEQQLKT